MSRDKNLQAYVIGLALGDGNLSKFPRTIRLRITCDDKYPNLMNRIEDALQQLLPENKVSRLKRPRNCTDISCYSSRWEELLGWTATGGSKIRQDIRVPQWVKNDTEHIRYCLRGLFETDGSVYMDRKYLMANFVSATRELAYDVIEMTILLGFKVNTQENHSRNRTKYTVRISKRAQEFIDLIGLCKN